MLKTFRLLTASLITTLSLVLSVSFVTSVPTSELTGALHWRSVRPYVGGVSIAVTGVAKEPNVYYMGSTGGGVWESHDYLISVEPQPAVA